MPVGYKDSQARGDHRQVDSARQTKAHKAHAE
jgi:hypothetical protein